MKFTFTGDIIFCGKFQNLEQKKDLLDKEVFDFLQDADYCVCDIEGPICTQKFRNDKVALKNNPNIKSFLDDIKGNVLFLGNNHIYDYDEAGLFETLDFAKENNLKTIGAGKNIEEASEAAYFDDLCGILALRYSNKHARAGVAQSGCLIWDEDEIIESKIKEIKQKAKWCILVVHGGDEFCLSPFPSIRNRYKKFLDWGADIIVAHHPHIIQNYEFFGDKMVFYSLGNFIFDDNYMRVCPESKYGILLKLNISNESVNWEYVPILIDGEQGKIFKTECPEIFNQIENEEDYKKKLKIALNDFYKKERQNLKYQFKRKDIKLKGKCRIILSHIKRYIKLKKNAKKMFK